MFFICKKDILYTKNWILVTVNVKALLINYKIIN